MTRVEEAILAFIGDGEVEGKPLSLSRLVGRDADRERINNLLAEEMIEFVGDELCVSVNGWRFLDRRSRP